MSSIFRDRKFAVTLLKEYYLPQRSEGRIKSYESCTDMRAWSLHEKDRSDHLYDLIKLDTPFYGFIPKNVLMSLLGSMGDTNQTSTYLGNTTDPLQDTKAFVGDSTENEKELKRIIAEKDKEINSLKNLINELKAKCGKEQCSDTNETVNKLQDELAKLKEEKEKTNKIKPSDGSELEELKLKIQQLEDMKKEMSMEKEQCKLEKDKLTKERDALLSDNKQLEQNMEEFNEHIESISKLKLELKSFTEFAELMLGNGQKYRKILENTLNAALDYDGGKKSSELEKKKRKFEEEIKSQLDEALQMYIWALEEIDEKQKALNDMEKEVKDLKEENTMLKQQCSGDSQGLEKELEKLKKENTSLKEKCSGDSQGLEKELEKLRKEIARLKEKCADQKSVNEQNQKTNIQELVGIGPNQHMEKINCRCMSTKRTFVQKREEIFNQTCNCLCNNENKANVKFDQNQSCMINSGGPMKLQQLQDSPKFVARSATVNSSVKPCTPKKIPNTVVFTSYDTLRMKLQLQNYSLSLKSDIMQ